MSQGQDVAYEGAGARVRLLERAAAAEREEGRLRASDTQRALSLWRDLVEGRWRFVERFETAGRRYYVGCENPAGTLALTALSPRERLVVAVVGSGQSEKVAMHALGLGPSAVSSLLKAALAKLGMRSRTDLVVFMRAIGLSHEQITSACTVGGR
jgi:DNA-binding CsgD family transcriptional regulator